MHLKVSLHDLGTGDGLGDAAATAARPQHVPVLATLHRLGGVINDISQFGAAVDLQGE